MADSVSEAEDEEERETFLGVCPPDRSSEPSKRTRPDEPTSHAFFYAAREGGARKLLRTEPMGADTMCAARVLAQVKPP